MVLEETKYSEQGISFLMTCSENILHFKELFTRDGWWESLKSLVEYILPGKPICSRTRSSEHAV
jgi:hypothetical protein